MCMKILKFICYIKLSEYVIFIIIHERCAFDNNNISGSPYRLHALFLCLQINTRTSGFNATSLAITLQICRLCEAYTHCISSIQINHSCRYDLFGQTHILVPCEFRFYSEIKYNSL